MNDSLKIAELVAVWHQNESKLVWAPEVFTGGGIDLKLGQPHLAFPEVKNPRRVVLSDGRFGYGAPRVTVAGERSLTLYGSCLLRWRCTDEDIIDVDGDEDICRVLRGETLDRIATTSEDTQLILSCGELRVAKQPTPPPQDFFDGATDCDWLLVSSDPRYSLVRCGDLLDARVDGEPIGPVAVADVSLPR